MHFDKCTFFCSFQRHAGCAVSFVADYQIEYAIFHLRTLQQFALRAGYNLDGLVCGKHDMPSRPSRQMV